MTGNERHYISEPQNNGGCERERLVSYFKNTTQFTVTDGEGRGEGKVQDQVPRRLNVALFPPREPRKISKRSRAGSNVLARSIYAYVECGDSHRERVVSVTT